MEVITRTAELERACEALARSPYVTVDTEFIRETTFWPELCLVQLASDDTTALVDPLADGLSLEPGSKLNLVVKARDRFDLGDQANVGSSRSLP